MIVPDDTMSIAEAVDECAKYRGISREEAAARVLSAIARGELVLTGPIENQHDDPENKN